MYRMMFIIGFLLGCVITTLLREIYEIIGVKDEE